MTPEFPDECTTFKDMALREILADARVEVVVLAGYWSAPEKRDGERGYVRVPHDDPSDSGLDLLRSGLTAIIGQLTAAHKRVIVLQDVPDMGIDPLKIALDEYIPARRFVSNLFDRDVDSMRSGRLSLTRVDRHEDVRAAVAEVAAAAGRYQGSVPALLRSSRLHLHRHAASRCISTAITCRRPARTLALQGIGADRGIEAPV